MENIHVFLSGTRGARLIQSLVKAGHAVASAYALPETVASGKLSNLAGGVSVEAVEDVNAPSFVTALSARNPRLIIIGGFSAIFGKSLRDIPRLGVINLHAGPLPSYRGGSPLNWQIINGEREAVISIIRIDEGIDTGEVLAEAQFPIKLDETIADIHENANALFPKLVLDVVKRLDENNFAGRTQDPTKAKYWHQRNADDGRIYWRDMTARQVHDLIRALDPLYPAAFAFWQGRRVLFRRSRSDDTVIRGVPGRVCYLNAEGPYIICKDQAVLVSGHEIEGNENKSLPHGAHLD